MASGTTVSSGGTLRVIGGILAGAIEVQSGGALVVADTASNLLLAGNADGVAKATSVQLTGTSNTVTAAQALTFSGLTGFALGSGATLMVADTASNLLLAGNAAGLAKATSVQLTGTNNAVTKAQAAVLAQLPSYSLASGATLTVTDETLATVAATLPGGGKVNLDFDTTLRGAAGQGVMDRVHAAVQAGNITAATIAPGGTAPAIPQGQSGALIMHGAGAYAIGTGYLTALIDAPARVTVSGGAAAGQLVMAGAAGLAFNAGQGAGTVFAGGGDNLVSMYPEAGAGSQYVDLGSGNDTVIGLAGNNTIAAGAGSNMILLGSGANQVNSTGTDLIAGGNGTATITAGTNAPVVFLGTGNSQFVGGGGRSTVVGGSGAATMNSAGNAQLWLGSVTDVVNSTGADTVIARTGAATVNANAGNMFVFAGGGSLDFRAGSGASTVLGSSGSATLRGGAGSIIALAYAPMRYIGGNGADTIAAFGVGSALTATGGSGTTLFLGGPSGHNSITGGSGTSIIFGGGEGDVLTAGTGAGDTIKGGTGAETISAAGTHGVHKIYSGSGPNLILTGDNNTSVLLGTGAATIVAGAGIDLYAFTSGNHPDVVIQNFKSGSDFVALVGFAAGEASSAIAGSTRTGGSQILTLSDGTHITFQNFTGLALGNFM